MNQTWQGIRSEVEQRLQNGVWRPGDLIPTEVALAREFACARATVNRALRSLAEDGWLERKRKAGTRVALTPTTKAVFRIPLLREEIEGQGACYRHRLLSRRHIQAPRSTRLAMGITETTSMLRLEALHLADERPYCLELRWINPGAVPGILDVEFTNVSSNEFLLKNIPYSRGALCLTANGASKRQAEILATDVGAALFQVKRTTWHEDAAITTATLWYPPGYTIETPL